MKNNFNLTSLLLLLLIISCKNVSENVTMQTSVSNEVETFANFINKFRNDSIFRKSRIIYPLKGFNSDDYKDGDSIEYEWTNKMINYYLDITYSENNHIRKIEESKNFVKETIIVEGTGFKIISKYILKKNKWYLSYYFYQNE